ncbi:hypothetical protein ACWDA7_45305 [Streptomyces sp. NPDC001156]
MGYGGGSLAATGIGVSVFGYYIGQWQLVLLAIAMVMAGALVVRATKPLRRDHR